MTEQPATPPDAQAALRDRAISGVAAVAVRGVVAKAVGFATTVVLARILRPDDFGVLAVGLAIVAAGGLLADAGLAAGLIRRAEDPTEKELHAMLTIQLAVALTVSTAALVIGVTVGGQTGRVAGVMALALPIIALRGPVVATLERDLRYRPIVAAEMLETVTFFVGAVGLAAIGLGVWGVALAAIVRSAVGSAFLIRTGEVPVALGASWSVIRELIPFGLRYQGVAAVTMTRDQAVNFGTLAIAGLGVLGTWAVSYRLMSVLFILFGSLWRVSYPATTKLLAMEADPSAILARALSGIAAATGVVTVPLAAAASLGIPLVLGAEWTPVADVVPVAALGLTIAGPISVAAAGYLFATSRAGTVLRSAVLHTVGWLVTGLPLLPVFGVFALGIGWLVASAIEAFVLGRALQATLGLRVVSAVWRPVCIATLVGGLWFMVAAALEGWSGLVLVGFGSAATYVACLWAIDPKSTSWMLRVARRLVAHRPRHARSML